MPELAISTWSLHHELGPIYPGLDLTKGPRAAEHPYGEGSIGLLEVPGVVAELGIHTLEICHFHFPFTGDEYVAQFRASLAEAGVQALTLLIDDGDISAEDPAARERDLARIRGWIEIAAKLGARQVRVIAGKVEPDPEGKAVRRSVEGLVELSRYAEERGVRVITENWLALSMQPEALLAILDGAGSAVGLCADFGNYTGPHKYEDLQRILPRASSIHANAAFSKPGEMAVEDFQHCLDLSRQAGFSGHYVLIFASPGEERPSIAQMIEVVRPYL